MLVGCGNSALSEHVVDSKFNSSVVSVDFSKVVVDKMSKRARSKGYEKSCLSYLVADVTRLDSAWTEAFDCVVDKGTLDAVMGEVGDENANADLSVKMLAEIDRVSVQEDGTLA